MTNAAMGSAELVAKRRLQHIVAATMPHAVARPSPVPCAGTPIFQLEGEAIGRLSEVKVVLLNVGERGLPLAGKDEMKMLFQQRSLVPVWVEKVDAIPDDATVLVTMGAPVGVEVLSKAPNLKLVAAAFTGVDHIDIDACKARGVAVVHVPNYSTDATAELVIGLVLSHLRRLPQCHQNIQQGLWACPPQEDLSSKTVGIVGVGKIGMRLAELFKAFKVKSLIGYSLTQEAEFTQNLGKYTDSLAELFLDADIVCICTPLTPKTRGLISEKLMELLRPECLLINVSRGGVVDENALAKCLAKGQFRAALDVFSTEPLPQDSPLRSISSDALMMTPHVGYQSKASLQKRLDVTIKNILAFLTGGAINQVA